MNNRKLLVIDDDPQFHELVSFHLEGVVDEVLHAILPQQGIDLAKQESPAVILLDINMPILNGFEVCKRLKEDEQTRDIAILFLTNDKDVFHIAKALDFGGLDYITKPFEVVELQARVRSAFRTQSMIDLLQQKASLDALTGHLNRGGVTQCLEKAISKHREEQLSFSLCLVDVDDFQQINQKLGHGIGDEVLREIGAALELCRRDSDNIGRISGDSFAILFEDIEEADAESLTQQVARELAKLSIRSSECSLPLSCSIGLANCHPDSHEVTASSILTTANSAVMEAKKNGGACYMIASADEQPQID